MYHSSKIMQAFRTALLLALTVNQLFLALPASAGDGQNVAPFSARASAQATLIAPLPHQANLHKPSDITVYECDSEPLGDRLPLLLVHGLRGEYYRGFRWEMVIKRFKQNPEFSRKLKIFLVRYDSLAPVSTQVPMMQQAISRLAQATNDRPIKIMALSIGGNLVYDAMLDPEIDKKVDLLVTLGTPFHGSPLFSADWLQYGIYRSRLFPLTRIDQAVAYRLYFKRNPNLLTDYSWDNSDSSIPNIGRFSSRVPFGPRGDLMAGTMVNKELASINDKSFDKKKIVAYSGYLLNPYMRPNTTRVIESAITAPYSLLTILLPAHLAREHPVLKMLNSRMSAVVANQNIQKEGKTSFVYALNDGITPISSALFLTKDVLASNLVCKESDFAKVRNSIDVRTARVFRNIDHLTFIDGTRPRPVLATTPLKDELNPDTQAREDIFSWMLWDIAQCDQVSGALAREPATKMRSD
jgi:hypothetical protein